MATGGERNRSQMQLGYGSCVWGTERVTACPPGAGATQRLSVAGTVSDSDELHQSGKHGEEDVTQSPPVPGQRGPTCVNFVHATNAANHYVGFTSVRCLAENKIVITDVFDSSYSKHLLR